jgi:flagellar L-ring protein FlgH
MKICRRMERIALVTLALLVLVGCMPSVRPPRSPQELARDYNPIPSPLLPLPEEGSLWSPATAVNPYSDVKARLVGDIVTISVVESAQASKKATTNTERESGLAANWTGVFTTLAKNFTINGAALPSNNKIAFANNFDGEGETTRTSSMTAYITARVLQVLSNGQMVIRGAREVQVNNETQFIFVQGVIRPEDISSNNIILSTYIADARIELTGYGSVSDKQRPGWMGSILDLVWPF